MTASPALAVADDVLADVLEAGLSFEDGVTDEDRQRAERAESSLRDFLELVVWPIAEPETPFVGGFHIDAIAEHLEALSRREIRKLLITIPPRHTKSLLCSVAFPAWEWVSRPASRFLTSSYSADLALDHAVLTRRVIEHPIYQAAWGHRFQMAGDQNVKSYYENTRRGYRIATSVGGTATGRGGDFLICDDPHNLKKIHHARDRRAAVSWYRQVWSTRLNNPQTGCLLTIMQRGHEKDVAGMLLEQGDYEHLNLPTEYEPTTYVTGIGWSDPRTTAGELLCPERYGPDEVADAKKTLTESGFATQHQQRPTPLEGGMFKRKKLRDRIVGADELPDEPYREVRYWDLAATDEEDGKDPDFTVGAKLRYYPEWGKIVVAHVVRGRWDPDPTDQKIAETAKADGTSCPVRYEREGGSAGKRVTASLRRLLMGYDFDEVLVSKQGSKTDRARPLASQVGGGNVYLLEGPWNEAFIDELAIFPRGSHDDQVDAASGAFSHLTDPETETPGIYVIE